MASLRHICFYGKVIKSKAKYILDRNQLVECVQPTSMFTSKKACIFMCIWSFSLKLVYTYPIKEII